MGDFLRTSFKAGLLIFGAHWLLQKMNENSDSEDVVNMLKQMVASGSESEFPTSGEMEKEFEMLMLQDNGRSPYEMMENNPAILPPDSNAPLSMRAAAEHLSPLADSIQRIYPSNQLPTNYEKMNFIGRKTNIQPYTSNKIRRLQQQRARFQAQFSDQYAAAGPIRGNDPMDSPYLTFQ